MIAGAGPSRRPLTGPIYSSRGKQEQVLIPLGLDGRYSIDTSWDRTTVVYSNDRTETKARSRATGGEVVTNLAVTLLSYSTARAEIELSRPATPLVKRVKRGKRPHLLLTFLR